MIEKYNIPIEYVKSVAKGYHKGFIFQGEPGIGKTHITKETLNNIGVSFIESRGVSSPLALYEFLYEYKDYNGVLLFDDINGLINNQNAFSLLISALWDGLVSWNTTDKMQVEKSFNFNSRIIIITNKLNGTSSDIIKSRCLTYELYLSRSEKLELMRQIAQKDGDLTESESLRIVNFIEANTDEETLFDLRTQYKITQLCLYDPLNWEDLAIPLLKRRHEVEAYLYALKDTKTTREAEQIFIQNTGLSRRTFYNIKQQMKGGF